MSTPRRHGFTLIEMMVALTIVVIMFAAVIYGVGALTGARAKESSTELAGVIRNLYDTAALSGKTCRLVFDLPGEREESGSVTWRAECAKSGITAAAKRDEELKAAGNKKGKDQIAANDARFKRLDNDGQPSLQDLQDREKNRVDAAAKFSSFQSDDVVEKHLPPGVKVEVWTAKQKDKVKSGTAYLYFFPQGFTERAQVWLKQGTNAWTVTISPLTGKTVIFSEDLEVPRS